MPITLFHRHDLSPDGSNPLLVNVYGAYGTDIEMDYSPEKIVLLDRGWIVAYCHVRLVQVDFFFNIKAFTSHFHVLCRNLFWLTHFVNFSIKMVTLLTNVK